jgi:hypothetical protein
MVTVLTPRARRRRRGAAGNIGAAALVEAADITEQLLEEGQFLPGRGGDPRDMVHHLAVGQFQLPNVGHTSLWVEHDRHHLLFQDFRREECHRAGLPADIKPGFIAERSDAGWGAEQVANILAGLDADLQPRHGIFIRYMPAHIDFCLTSREPHDSDQRRRTQPAWRSGTDEGSAKQGHGWIRDTVCGDAACRRLRDATRTRLHQS